MKIYKLTEDTSTDKLLKLSLGDLEKLNKIFEAGKEIRATGIMIGIENINDNIETKEEPELLKDYKEFEEVVEYRTGNVFNVLELNKEKNKVILYDLEKDKRKTIKYSTFKKNYKR